QPAPLWIPHAPVIPHGRRAVSPYDSTSSTSVTETVSRTRHAGASGQLTVRADSAIYSKDGLLTARKMTDPQW
ncbi:hypothetical protein ACWGJT_34635, partial [Streptomyces xantholiticus]